MSQFLQNVKQNIQPKQPKGDIKEQDLGTWGLTGIKLRSYQLDGLNWLVQCFNNQHGCILGDEMGLGKTCQTISLLVYAVGSLNEKGPFLILSPLSVVSNWKEELERFAPNLSVVVCTGDKEERAELHRDLKNRSDFHILLTTYEICIRDACFLKRFDWRVLVVDEAHRLKNQNSLLHKMLSEFSVGFTVLLTGTPVQNSLQELFSLLSFIEPQVFPEHEAEGFVTSYRDVETQKERAAELHSLLQPFLLRRVKTDVAAELPRKSELVVYHGMSALQKKYYRAVLTKDLGAFDNERGSKARLSNILIQLRKCVDHPYLFDGVEPEPFEIGDHLIEASGKLHLLDTMLSFLHDRGHRVLLFSQMTRMLDVLQDYMEYRGYSYERLDGSVRGEERHLAIKNFSSKDVFVFLLSTKAGGVGMNLTAADTVIFVDSDFNPQNDLQAAARAHRIGQKRPVKIIRLIGRDTVEEIVYRRAMSKLKLTNAVIEGGQFSHRDEGDSSMAADMQLSEILKFGVDKLLSSEESTIRDVDLGKILGKTRKGEWVTEDPPLPTEDESSESEETETHMYLYEGKDYSKEPSAEDKKTFEHLLDLENVLLADAGREGRALRNKSDVLLTGLLDVTASRKRVLSPEELQQRRQKRQAAAAKRAKLMEDKKQQRKEAEHKKKLAWWESCGYHSLCVSSEDSEEEKGGSEDEGSDDVHVDLDSTDSEHTAIHYIMGDVTHPQAAREDAIIVHCVDDSGRWGRGGLFMALEIRSDQPRRQYELAGKMKDLGLGNVLMFPIDDKESRHDGQDLLALIVTQQRDRSNNVSGIKLPALEEGLKKISTVAKKKKASVHLPRIGHATKGFNWYGTERLIRKYFASRNIPTYIYYYSKKVPSSVSQPTASSRKLGSSDDQQSGHMSQHLAEFMSGVNVYFYNLLPSERKYLARYLSTYDGTEDTVLGSETTHVVAEVENAVHMQDLQTILQGNPQVTVVQKKWLEACFSKQKKVSTAQYQIDFD
ncbi:chromodomain-helicase-DNA-binding protein 1-like [Huso huso]|uniref:Chromodomain-helicase-DNA-binding protein 1-like n=1 Tax=Huso huso TaxID=61971 RepID=A0ABR0ZQ43_HUSHU